MNSIEPSAELTLNVVLPPTILACCPMFVTVVVDDRLCRAVLLLSGLFSNLSLCSISQITELLYVKHSYMNLTQFSANKI